MRAVFFDLDGTLFDRTGTLRRIAGEQAAELGGLLGQQSQDSFIDKMVELDRLMGGKRTALYRRLVNELDLEDWHPRLHPKRLSEDFDRRYAAETTAADGALETLHALRQRGISAGIITNGSQRIQHAKIKALGLLDLVDAVLISQAERVHKPNPALFQRALMRIGVSASEAIHVGDHPVHDIQAAQFAGMRAFWLDTGCWPEPEPAADRRLRALPELLHGIG